VTLVLDLMVQINQWPLWTLDYYPIDCRLPDLYVPQSCWQHARNNTVPPEEEVRVGLLNYALVLWIIVIIVIRCTFFSCAYFWNGTRAWLYSSWEHTFTPLCALSIHILRTHSWLFCLTHWPFFSFATNSEYSCDVLQGQSVLNFCNYSGGQEEKKFKFKYVLVYYAACEALPCDYFIF